MARIAIPPYLLWKIQLDPNVHQKLIDVELLDGRVYRRLMVQDQHYISDLSPDELGEGTLPFNSLDICNVQKHNFAFGRPGAF